MIDSSSRSSTAPQSLEEQLAELRAVVIGLYDMMKEDFAQVQAELERLRDADVQMERTIRELQAALTAHLPTTAAYLSVQEAHLPVPGAHPPGEGRTHK